MTRSTTLRQAVVGARRGEGAERPARERRRARVPAGVRFAGAAVVPLVYNDHILWRRPWVTGMWTNAIARSTFADAVIHRRGPRTEADDPR